MEESKGNFALLALVGIVAIVGLTLLFMNSADKGTVVQTPLSVEGSGEAQDISGMARYDPARTYGKYAKQMVLDMLSKCQETYNVVEMGLSCNDFCNKDNGWTCISAEIFDFNLQSVPGEYKNRPLNGVQVGCDTKLGDQPSGQATSAWKGYHLRCFCCKP